ncbi:MAG TPA: hypothetical protein VLV88_07625 [Terriglobales bacterium]|nr:hypothetical protein [Terriglobales bacterium]
MKRNSFSLLSLLVGALSFAACSGPPGGWPGGGGGGGTGTATVSFTLVSDTLPAIPSLLSYTVMVNGVTLTPTGTGTPVTLTPSPSPTIDLVRLQSDSAYLGTLTGVPAGSYTVTASISGVGITFFNNTASSITVGTTACPSGDVCSFSLSASGSPQIATFTFTAASNGTQGIGLDMNLNSSLTITGGVLTGNFSSGVLSAFTLPRQGSNLSAGQLDLIEDFTGVVSLTQANSVSINSPIRGIITASSTSTTAYDPDPTGTLCNNAPTSLSGCVASNQFASMDAVLNADGTFSVQEIEPTNASVQDIVEGTVAPVAEPANTFAIIVTDKLPAASGSLISSLKLGDPLVVNIANIPNTFYVDTKGLDVQSASPAAYGSFFGQSTTSAIFAGQSIAIHVTGFTAQSGSTPALATADTVTLRFSRLTSVVQPLTSSTFTISSIPTYFFFTPSSTFLVQAFVNAPRNTNIEGVTDLSNLSTTKPVSMRALYFNNSSGTLSPTFFAAKVRQY